MADSSARRISTATARDLWPAMLIAFLFASLLAAATFAFFSGRNLFGDEGSFCAIGQGIVDGHLPYRDLFNEKPPLQYFWTAAVMTLGGPTLAGARLAASIALVLTAGAIVLGPLLRRASPLVVLGFMLVTAAVAVRLEAFLDTADSSLAVLYAASAILVTRGPRQTWDAVLLGALFGLALGFRQTALATALVLVVSPRMAGTRAAFFAGAAGGLLAWLGPLAAVGLLDDLIQATVLFHVGNSGAAGYLMGDPDARAGVVTWVLVMAAVALRPASSHRERLWILGWLLVMALAYVGRKHEFRLWPSAASALAILAWDPRVTIEATWRRQVRVAAPLALAVVVAATAIYRAPARPSYVEAMVSALEQASSPGDSVWVGPFAPHIYCLAQRRPASRFYFLLPWTAKPEVRQELARDLLTKRPVIMIWRLRNLDLDAYFPELGPILEAQYRLAPSDGGRPLRSMEIYVPVQGSGAPGSAPTSPAPP